MFNNIDLYKPDKIIRCSEYEYAREIYKVMSKMSARVYAYSIAYVPRDEFRLHYLKIGMSSPTSERVNDNILGERIVRQVAHLHGWSKEPISAHGSDFRDALKKLVEDQSISEAALHKDNIMIGVWNIHHNFRKCMALDATPEEQAKWLEGTLTEQFKRDFKEDLPILNKQDPSNNKVMKKTWTCAEVEPELFSF